MLFLFTIPGDDAEFISIPKKLHGMCAGKLAKVNNGQLIGPWEIWMKIWLINFQVNFSDWWLGYLSCETDLR